jgi:hypothetical protein
MSTACSFKSPPYVLRGNLSLAYHFNDQSAILNADNVKDGENKEGKRSVLKIVSAIKHRCQTATDRDIGHTWRKKGMHVQLKHRRRDSLLGLIITLSK